MADPGEGPREHPPPPYLKVWIRHCKEVLQFINHYFMIYQYAFEVRVLNKSQRLAKFYVSLEITPFFTWFKTYTETTNDSQQLARRTNSKNIVFMCCHWIKKLKFNDICVLSKNSNFCSRMLEMHVWSEAQISNFFLGGMLPDPPPPQTCEFFCISA